MLELDHFRHFYVSSIESTFYMCKGKQAYDRYKCCRAPFIKSSQIIQQSLVKFLSVYSQDINPNSLIFTKKSTEVKFPGFN